MNILDLIENNPKLTFIYIGAGSSPVYRSQTLPPVVLIYEHATNDYPELELTRLLQSVIDRLKDLTDIHIFYTDPWLWVSAADDGLRWESVIYAAGIAQNSMFYLDSDLKLVRLSSNGVVPGVDYIRRSTIDKTKIEVSIDNVVEIGTEASLLMAHIKRRCGLQKLAYTQICKRAQISIAAWCRYQQNGERVSDTYLLRLHLYTKLPLAELMAFGCRDLEI